MCGASVTYYAWSKLSSVAKMFKFLLLLLIAVQIAAPQRASLPSLPSKPPPPPEEATLGECAGSKRQTARFDTN